MEMLEIIVNFLLTRVDVCRFRAVCKSWRSSIPPFRKPVSLPLKVPCLLFPLNSPEYQPNILAETTVYHVASPPPDAGNSWGWLLKVKERQAGHFDVLNSLSCKPSNRFPTFPKVINLLDFQVSEVAKAYTLGYANNVYPNWKLVFSSIPNYRTPSFMVLGGGVLFYLKKGDEKWTEVIVEDKMGVAQFDYEDVIVYNNKFCAVDKDGRAVVIDSSLNVTEIASPLKCRRINHTKILVESLGDLILIEILQKRTNFKVFKLKVEDREWMEVKSLDNRIFFFGNDSTFCVAAKDFGNGCKGDCIILTHNSVFTHSSSYTVFNLEDSSMLPLVFIQAITILFVYI